MDEIREKLKPYVGKRLKVRGVLSKFDLWTDRKTQREIGRACISLPEMAGELIANHVWVMDVNHWSKAEIGKQVEFEALVKQYADPKVGGNNYHLIYPDDLQVLHDPPALRIPDPPEDEELLTPEEKPTVIDEKNVAENPLETLRQVKAFIKAVGGQKHALNMANELEKVTIPVPDLIAWIKAMGESE